MKVKLDEDRSPLVAEPLRTDEYEVLTVVGQGWGGTADPEFWPRVVAEKAFFISADTGFGDQGQRTLNPLRHKGLRTSKAEFLGEF